MLWNHRHFQSVVLSLGRSWYEMCRCRHLVMDDQRDRENLKLSTSAQAPGA